MKFWFPESLYRLKPLLIILTGATLIYISNGWLIRGIGLLCLVYAAYILVMRLRWSSTGMLKTNSDYFKPGDQKTYDIRQSSK